MKNYQLQLVRVMAIVACLLTLQTLSAQWPQWRGPNRDGYCTETNLLKSWPAEGPKLVWSSDTLGEGFSSATIQDKTIYTTGKKDSSEIMTALDFNGKILWQQTMGKAFTEDWPESRSTPTFYKGKLYAVTVRGDVCCLDSRSGRIFWKISIPEKFEGISANGKQFCESPLVEDDKVILTPGGKSTTIVALNPLSGETIWKSESIPDSTNFVSPVLLENSGKKLIVTNTNKYAIAADLNTGKIIWKEQSLNNGFVPLPYGNRVYFSKLNADGEMLTVGQDMNSFSYQKNDTIRVNCLAGTVKLGNRIFGAFGKRKGIFCMDSETGKVIYTTNEVGLANLIAADGMIYGYDGTGLVFLLKPNENSANVVGSFKVKLGKGNHIAHMSIANGLLFIRHGKYLMAYDVTQPKGIQQ